MSSQSYDPRDSDITQFIFKGFTGLHYASYFGHLPIAQLLRDYEGQLVTQLPTTINIDTCCQIVYNVPIPAGLSCLHLSIISNAVSVSDMFLARYETMANTDFLHRSTSPLFSILGCLILQGSSDSLQLLERYHDVFLNHDARDMHRADIDPIAIATITGRKNFLISILSLSQSKLYGDVFEPFVRGIDFNRIDATKSKIPQQLHADADHIHGCYDILHKFVEGHHEPAQQWMGGVRFCGRLLIKEVLNHSRASIEVSRTSSKEARLSLELALREDLSSNLSTRHSSDAHQQSLLVDGEV